MMICSCYLAFATGEEIVNPFRIIEDSLIHSFTMDSLDSLDIVDSLDLGVDSLQQIYIYITLREPPGCAPPGEVLIRDTRDTVNPFIYLGTNEQFPQYCDKQAYFHVYRDSSAIFWMKSIDTATNRVGQTYLPYFKDDADAELIDRALNNPDLNLFYIFTIVKPLGTSGKLESFYPSPCAGEYDFKIYNNPDKTNRNLIAYCINRTDIAASDGDASIFAQTFNKRTSDDWVSQVSIWDARMQAYVAIAYHHYLFGWQVFDSVEVGMPYTIEGDNVDDSSFIWPLNRGGQVPEEIQFELWHHDDMGSYNLIMLPFKYQQVANIDSSKDLGIDINGCSEVDKWDPKAQNWVALSYYHALFGWTLNSAVVAGRPYRIEMSFPGYTDSVQVWP